MMFPDSLLPKTEKEILKEVSNELNIPYKDVLKTFNIWLDYIEYITKKTEEEEKQYKTRIRKIYDTIVDIGKKTNDWKNLVVLPVELHDKVPRLLEMGQHIGKFLGIT